MQDELKTSSTGTAIAITTIITAAMHRTIPMETIVRDYILFNVLVKAKRVKNWFERQVTTENRNETRKNLLDISPFIMTVFFKLTLEVTYATSSTSALLFSSIVLT